MPRDAAGSIHGSRSGVVWQCSSVAICGQNDGPRRSALNPWCRHATRRRSRPRDPWPDRAIEPRPRLEDRGSFPRPPARHGASPRATGRAARRSRHGVVWQPRRARRPHRPHRHGRQGRRRPRAGRRDPSDPRSRGRHAGSPHSSRAPPRAARARGSRCRGCCGPRAIDQVSPTSRWRRSDVSKRTRASANRPAWTAIIPRLFSETPIAQRSPISAGSERLAG